MSAIEDDLDGIVGGNDNASGSSSALPGVSLFNDYAKLIGNINTEQTDCLPQVEPEAPSCAAACRELEKKREEECKIMRKRIELYLERKGCPSVVRAKKKGGGKRTTCKKKRSTKSRCGC